MPGARAISRHCIAAATVSSENCRRPPTDAGVDNQAPALPLPDRPSIAVLPFANMSEDPDQEHFADGISEDLITGLSRIHWLFVIARNSTFVYKNRAVDVKQVARELGVRYVLEGSVRRAGKRIRISAQLVDAITRRPSLGRTLRPRTRRHLRRAGRDHPQCGCGDRTPPAGGGGRSRALAIAGRSWRLGTGGARAKHDVWRLTRADYATAIKGLEQARRDLSGLCAGAQPAGVLSGVFGAYGLDRSRAWIARRPPARHSRHRAR